MAESIVTLLITVSHLVYSHFRKHSEWICKFFMKMDKDMLLMRTELSPWILLLTRSYSLSKQ
ncbi:hypothetical protein BC941DRAFT_442567 [Chlamydoabsidia padenii]|nr:hypothetical protein BC941DRAFT_442567 [Chlamydoabsidia padenii]